MKQRSASDEEPTVESNDFVKIRSLNGERKTPIHTAKQKRCRRVNVGIRALPEKQTVLVSNIVVHFRHAAGSQLSRNVQRRGHSPCGRRRPRQNDADSTQFHHVRRCIRSTTKRLDDRFATFGVSTRLAFVGR